jgi:hypothetical protein
MMDFQKQLLRCTLMTDAQCDARAIVVERNNTTLRSKDASLLHFPAGKTTLSHVKGDDTKR